MRRPPRPTALVIVVALSGTLSACATSTPRAPASPILVAGADGAPARPRGVSPSPVLPAPPRAVPAPKPVQTPAPPFPLLTATFPLHRMWPAVTRFLATREGEATVAVYDATTRRVYAFEPAETFWCASIVKVQIIATLLHESEHGEPLSDADRSELTSMIEVSDNDAATSLWNLAGAANGIGAFDRLASMAGTVPNAFGYWGSTETTAVDQLRLLGTLAYGNRLIDDDDRRYALGLMEHVDPAQAWGVTSGVDAGTTVALKNGWLPVAGGGWIVNSIGAVSGSGRSYLIAVLTRDDPSYGYGIDTVEGVSAIVWRSVGLGPQD